MFDNYINRTFGVESSNNPFAKNPRSSATGLGQFTDGTWQGLMNLYPELGLTADGRTDPVQAKRAMEQFTFDNANTLKKSGYDPTDNNLYAMHRFGSQGGLNLLQADPNAPINSVVGSNVLSANPDLNGKTVGQVLNRWQDGGTGTDMSAQSRQPGNFSGTTVFPGKRDAQPAADGGFLPGGPGGLIGLPNGMTSGGYDVGSALQGAGAGLASIGSPAQGAALTALQKSNNDDQYSMVVNPATGAIVRINKKTGKVEAVTGAVPQKSKFDDAYDSAAGKQYAEMGEKISTTAQNSQSALGQLGALRQALTNPNVYQGYGGESILQLKKAAQAVGFPVDGIADSELAGKISKSLALELRNPTGGAGMPGALSDSDRKYLTQMVAGLDNSPQGNGKILDLYQRVHQRNLDVDKLREDYVAQHGRLDSGFNKVVREWAAAPENQLFNATAPAATAAQAPANRPPLSAIFQ
jgi:hypothetical protein